MTDVSQVTQVAKGISDYGALTIMAALYLVLSATILISLFKWFKNIIHQIMSDNKVNLENVLAETQKQNELLNDLVEGLRPETQLRIRNLTDFAFDLSIEQVCRLIKRIREENHIKNKEATLEKIHRALKVIYENRSSRFDTFTFRGVILSKYCNPEWINQVTKVVENELYHEDGANNKRAFDNVKLAYDNIKTDFYYRLNNK